MANPTEMWYPLQRQDDYPAWISFRTYRNPKASAQTQTSDNQANQTFKNSGVLVPNNEVVNLYLPGALTYNGNVNYENASLGARGAITLEGIQAGKSAFGIAGSVLKDNATSLVDLVKAGSIANASVNPAIQNVLAKIISRDVPPQDLADAAQAGLRITDNPNFRTLFRDVPIRAFPFEFELKPESEKEMNMIKHIIKYFRTELYPTRIPSPAGIESTFGYNFPRMFQIRAWYTENGTEKDLGHRFKPAYLTSFNVTYNPESQSFFKGGEFTTYRISMEFTEHRALTAEDIEENY